MSPTNRAYVCLSCLLKNGRHSFSTSRQTASTSNPIPKSASPQSIIYDAAIQPSPHHLPKPLPDTRADERPAISGAGERQNDGLKLEAKEAGRLRRLEELLKKVSANAAAGPSNSLPVSEAVKQSLGTFYMEERAVLMRLVKTYGDRDLTGLSSELHRASQVGGKRRPVTEGSLQKLVKDIQEADFFGISVVHKVKALEKATPNKGSPTTTSAKGDQEQETDGPENSRSGGRRRIRAIPPKTSGVSPPRKTGANLRLAKQVVSSRSAAMHVHRKEATKEEKRKLALEEVRLRLAARKGPADDNGAGPDGDAKEPAAVSDPFEELEPDKLQTVEAQDLFISPIEGNTPPVPGLSYDLSRVLFNPGVYQLQDPRSRVFNFDPYLQHIMPVTEFDFGALKDFITSSEDEALSQIASDRGRKYVGSSSSMTSILVHFHFLLSHWREINTHTLSRGFGEGYLKTFTAIQRAPSAIFLRWKGGHYAIDADKQYDSANILMSLGKSMEKLFTLRKDEFERYRKSNETEFSEEERSEPESYHYTEMGRFLMRSQLDAHDPRLPGTGMFDLKTRAVVSIRMNATRHEEGLGYQIRERYGGWESYEREFYDMIRSAFLKYSLQVRMGRMDGIFVAYHNVERIFGFQYVSLPELDLHLHGQSDTTLGDQEFKISLAMLEEVFERATKKFPEQSLRFHFETRKTQTPMMYIIAEPVDEVEIKAIQASKKAQVAEVEKRLLGMAESQTAAFENDAETDSESSLPSSNSSKPDAEGASFDSIGKTLKESMQPSDHNSSTETKQEKEPKEILGMVLTIRNKVNGKIVERPNDLEADDKWTVEYTLTEMDRPSKAREVYKACKNRRKMELSRSNTEQDTIANYYLKKIRDITQQGAKWRKEQDELDKGREAVVLYGTGSGDRQGTPHMLPPKQDPPPNQDPPSRRKSLFSKVISSLRGD